MPDAVRHEEHFESIERQSLAATLGMWVFLASEVLFFGALFTAYAAYRARSPAGFSEGIRDNTLWWGSGNTLVLLTSSFTVALAVHRLRHGNGRAAARLTYATVGLGLLFLAIKAYEYYDHFHHGIFPGGRGYWFLEQERAPGAAAFWTLYFLMTGLHAIHVLVGMGALGVIGRKVARGLVVARAPAMLENGAMYWHLVDIVWLFLWPLFYLTKGSGS